jgi:isopenicillin N synthase-like dioxygenase
MLPAVVPNQSLINGIPFIDFAEFGDGTSDEARQIGIQLFTACKDVGFAYLINTGIPQERVDEMFQWSRKLFALPYDSKMAAPRPQESWWHRGYSGIGKEQVIQTVFDPDQSAHLHETTPPDHKESFDLGTPSPTARLPNIWLPDPILPGFREYATSFFEDCRSLQIIALRALAMGLPGVEELDFFEPYHTEVANQLRLLHYPGAPAEVFASGAKGRVAAHTDFGTCTFLFQDPQDTLGGLEVEDPHNPGHFVPAPPVPGSVVFNIGDLLMRWSNDILKSTLHRVRAPPLSDGELNTPARFSIPYFIGPDASKKIECLPGCYGPDRPKRYEPITAAEYIDMRMAANYK